MAETTKTRRKAAADSARLGEKDFVSRLADAGEEALQKLADLPGALVHVERAVIDDGDAGGIIAAIFEPPQPLHQDRRRVARPDISDDPAHASAPDQP